MSMPRQTMKLLRSKMRRANIKTATPKFPLREMRSFNIVFLLVLVSIQASSVNSGASGCFGGWLCFRRTPAAVSPAQAFERSLGTFIIDGSPQTSLPAQGYDYHGKVATCKQVQRILAEEYSYQKRESAFIPVPTKPSCSPTGFYAQGFTFECKRRRLLFQRLFKKPLKIRIKVQCHGKCWEGDCSRDFSNS